MLLNSDLLSNVIGFVWQKQQHIHIFVGCINEADGEKDNIAIRLNHNTRYRQCVYFMTSFWREFLEYTPSVLGHPSFYF